MDRPTATHAAYWRDDEKLARPARVGTEAEMRAFAASIDEGYVSRIEWREHPVSGQMQPHAVPN